MDEYTLLMLPDVIWLSVYVYHNINQNFQIFPLNFNIAIIPRQLLFRSSVCDFQTIYVQLLSTALYSAQLLNYNHTPKIPFSKKDNSAADKRRKMEVYN